LVIGNPDMSDLSIVQLERLRDAAKLLSEGQKDKEVAWLYDYLRALSPEELELMVKDVSKALDAAYERGMKKWQEERAAAKAEAGERGIGGLIRRVLRPGEHAEKVAIMQKAVGGPAGGIERPDKNKLQFKRLARMPA